MFFLQYTAPAQLMSVQVHPQNCPTLTSCNSLLYMALIFYLYESCFNAFVRHHHFHTEK